MLPVKVNVKKEEYSAMLITFIINGGDISKLLTYIDEEYILEDTGFVYLILGNYHFCSYSKGTKLTVICLKCFSRPVLFSSASR